MSTGAGNSKKAGRRGAEGEPVFISKSQLAHAIAGVDTQTIDEWVRAGTIPPPHSRPGKNTAVWLRRHFLYYEKNRIWPPEAWGR